MKTVEKTKDSKTYTAYENLAYFDACAGGVLDDTDKLEAAYQDTSKKSIEVSDSSTCATRFADAGVNDRLFTVWLTMMVKKCMSAMPMAILPMRKDQPNRRLKKKLTFTPVLTTKRLPLVLHHH